MTSEPGNSLSEYYEILNEYKIDKKAKKMQSPLTDVRCINQVNFTDFALQHH